MQRVRLALIIVLSGLVAVECQWKLNQEYNYKVFTKTLAASKDDTWNGEVFQARLTLRPEPDGVWFGKLSRPQYAQVQTSRRRADSDLNNLNYNDLPMDQPFNIVLRNGVVRALLVNRKLNENQVNQLKFVVKAVMNQLQIDGNAQNRMDGDNAAYNVNELTMMGNCETVYEISPLPQYLAQSSRDLVPMPRLQRQEQFIDVVKSRDYSRCNQQNQQNQQRNSRPSSYANIVPKFTEVSRIILSGSLSDYTVQSSVTTMKSLQRLNEPLETIAYVNITLESVDDNARYAPIQVDTLMDVENNYPPRASRKNVENNLLLMQINYPDYNGEIEYSGCFEYLPNTFIVCNRVFGGEYESIPDGAIECGYLRLGRKAKCQRQYPYCMRSVCQPLLQTDMCKVFGNDFPVQRGTMEICTPGFVSARCCPN
ncbi:vitellogenin-like [Bradysia coprophila]|uniref:vitellogenin-like n=1 Tax=Bradysia coprophila TaxID=38358 RepID=UPI00187DBF6E|nr:vitellogenin-like [Bradysia coprophila]